MNIQAYFEYCLSKKGVTEHFPFDEDTLVFKVGGNGNHNLSIFWNRKCLFRFYHRTGLRIPQGGCFQKQQL